MARSVREIMTPDPATVRPDSPASEAALLMRSEDVGSLPVVEDDKLVGLVTDRDIALQIVAEGKHPDSTRVGDIQSRDVASVAPDQSLDEALDQMARNKVRRIPVVEGDRLVGVIAQADVAKEAGYRETGRLVEEISE